MADFSAHAKVGIVIIVAALMVFAGLRLLERSVKGNVFYINVTFEDARGLSRGVDVRLGGVVYGNVTKVEYKDDRKLALVTVKMLKIEDARFRKDSIFVASEEGLVGEKIINIMEPKDSTAGWAEEGDEFKGVFEDGLKQLVIKGNETLDEVNAMIRQFGDTLDTDFINKIIEEMTAAVKGTLENVDKLLTNLDHVVVANSDEINETLVNMTEMTANFNDVSSYIKKLIQDPVLAKRLDSMSSELDASLASLSRIAADIEEITGDPEVQQGVKDAIKKTNEVLDEAKSTMGEIKGTLSDVQGKVDEIGKLTDVKVSGSVTGRYVNNDKPKIGQDEHSALADIDVKMETKKGFIQVGVAGIGEDSSLNLQAGRKVNEDLSFRGGIIRSKVGLGLDYDLGGAMFVLDGFDPNDPKLNSYLGFRLTEDYSFRVGVEDAFGETNLMAGLSVEF